MTVPDDCFDCAANARMPSLPARELVAADPYWRVTHAVDTALPGWLVLVPRRHVTAIADLTDAEAAALGSWQVRLSRALHRACGCQKTYVIQFAEAEGFQPRSCRGRSGIRDHPAGRGLILILALMIMLHVGC